MRDVRIDGRAVEASKAYRVTVPSFLASGGDGFRVLTEGKDPREGPVDVEALTSYLGRVSSSLRRGTRTRHAKPRITGDGCK